MRLEPLWGNTHTDTQMYFLNSVLSHFLYPNIFLITSYHIFCVVLKTFIYLNLTLSEEGTVGIILLNLYIVKKPYISEENSNSKRYNPQFIAALFTMAKTGRQPKCPSTDEWVKKLGCIYTHNEIVLSHEKNGMMPFKQHKWA